MIWSAAVSHRNTIILPICSGVTNCCEGCFYPIVLTRQATSATKPWHRTRPAGGTRSAGLLPAIHQEGLEWKLSFAHYTRRRVFGGSVQESELRSQSSRSVGDDQHFDPTIAHKPRIVECSLLYPAVRHAGLHQRGANRIDTIVAQVLNPRIGGAVERDRE